MEKRISWQNILKKLQNPHMKVALYLCGALCIGLGILVWRMWIQPGVNSIPPVGGITVERFHFDLLPIYKQNDPQWAKEKLGNTEESLAAVGCTISSVCMALAHYGITISPKQLNDRLKAINGYTQRGWLKWNAVATITDKTIVIRIPRQPSHALIDKALSAQKPVIAKIFLKFIIPHWVLIVGKSGQEYLIKDPLGPGDRLEHLSKFHSNIYAIRIVEQVGS